MDESRLPSIEERVRLLSGAIQTLSRRKARMEAEAEVAKATASRFTIEATEAINELTETKANAELILTRTAIERGTYSDITRLSENEPVNDMFMEALKFMEDVADLCGDVLERTEYAAEHSRRVQFYETELTDIECMKKRVEAQVGRHEAAIHSVRCAQARKVDRGVQAGEPKLQGSNHSVGERAVSGREETE